MNGIPNKIKIGNMEYSIIFQDPKGMKDVAESIDPEKEIGEAMGRIEYEKELIVLNATLTPNRMREVLVHEIVHGFLFESGLDDINTESTVDGLTHILRRFIKENDVSWMG